MSTRRALVGAAVLALVSALVMLLAAPSHAERIGMVVSNQASGPYRANLSTPLFEGQGLLVPGQRLESTFYLKNNTPTQARALLRIVPRRGSGGLGDWLTYDVGVHGEDAVAGGGRSRTGECSLLDEGVDFRPGEVQAVDVAVEMPDLVDQQGSRQRAAVDFVVTMSEVAPAESAGCEDPTGEPSPGGAPSPDVSAGVAAAPDCSRDVVVSMVGRPTCVPSAVDAGVHGRGARPLRETGLVPALAALLVGVGAGLVLGGRRRRDRHPA